MFKDLLKIKFFAAIAALLLGLFVWASFTGTRLLGDDKDSVDALSGSGNHSERSSGGIRYHSSGHSYHK